MRTDEQLNNFIAACKNRGTPLTPGYQKMLRVFYVLERPVAAEDLWSLLNDNGRPIAIATVYNGLRWLCDRGYARREKDGGKRSVVYRLTLP
jgi:Fe2+ or Zn2+ uptake regulation protein